MDLAARIASVEVYRRALDSGRHGVWVDP